MKREAYAAISLATSACLTVAKAVAAMVTNSLAVWAETFDSSLDVVNTAMGLAAVRVGLKPPDEDHAYGHGKFESLVAYTETLFIFVVAGYIVYESLLRFLVGAYLREVEVGISIFVATTLADVALTVLNYHGYRRTGSHVLHANYVNYMGDVGRSAVVLVSLAVSSTGYAVADPIASLLIAALMAREGIKLLKETLHVLLDSTPKGVPDRVREIAYSVDGVISVKSVRARSTGSGLFIDITISVHGKKSLEEAHKIADEVERKVLEEYGCADVVVHVEPWYGVEKGKNSSPQQVKRGDEPTALDR